MNKKLNSRKIKNLVIILGIIICILLVVNLRINSKTNKVKDEENIKEKLLLELEKSAEKDILLGFTTVGPHRDDIKIMCNFIDVRSFGSQGQQRTVALSLKLAELEFFNFAFGEYPVLLLDDVLSELDLTRQKKLLSHVQNIQCIITGIAFPFDIENNLLTCTNGEIFRRENE